MFELKRFKESYFKGSLLWVKGADAFDRVEATCNLLRWCGVEEDRIRLISWADFLKSRDSIRGKILVLHDLDKMEDEAWERFLRELRFWQRRLRFSDEARVILVSTVDSLASKEEDLQKLNPVVIHIHGEGNRVLGLDEWLHGLLKKASFAAKKPIFRVSERVAVFLESTESEWAEDELLDLLILGARRSTEGVLRLSDLFPQEVPKTELLSVL